MKPRLAVLMIALVSCLASSSGRADDGPWPSDPFSVVLKGLRPLPAGSSVTYYFVHSASGRELGYSRLSLTAREYQGRKTYEYRHFVDTALRGKRSTVVMEATLTPGFNPFGIQVKQTTYSPAGLKMVTEQSAVIEADQIVLITAAGGKTETRRVPRPPVEFVYGMAMLIERVDFDKYKSFGLSELDPQQGTAFTFAFSSEVDPDYVRTVKATWGPDDRAYYFVLDAEGRLDGWGQMPMAVEVKRTTPERVEQIKKRLKLD